MDTDQIIDRCASDYTIGIVKAEGPTPTVLGTGTLVKCRSSQGILTCGHVIKSMPTSGKFGVTLFAAKEGHDHRYWIDASVTVPHSVVIYTPPGTQAGPDIAFLPIPLTQFTSLAAVSSAVDLDAEKRKLEEPAPVGASFLGVVAGLVEENTPPAGILDGRTRLNVSGYGNVGDIKTYNANASWDFLEFVPRRESYEDSPPTSYGGTSGGGIWKLYLNEVSEGQFKIVETRLSGVAFWEDSTGGQLTITGHGPNSIYGQLLGEIYKRWPG